MRKKTVALVGITAVLTSWGLQTTLTAQAAQAVGAVQIAWADVAQGQLKITWTESSPVANTVQLKAGALKQLGTTSAAEPNELLVPIGDLGNSSDPADRVSIVVSDPGGGSAASPDFDRYLPHPDKVAMTTSPEGAARWTISPDLSDATAGDPLDVDGLTRYDVDLREQGSPHYCNTVDLSDSTSTTGVIPRRTRPYAVHVQPHNEWGVDLASAGPSGSVTTSALTITAPAATQYGTVTTITGGIGEFSLMESSPTRCEEWAMYGPSTNVTLQARDTATSAWYAVSNTKTGSVGAYRFTVKNAGAREFRVVADDQQRAGSFMYGASTAAKLVRSTTQVVSAKFIAPVITFGTKPQAYLWVDPAGSQQAALQFKNASGVWQGMTYKTLSSGRGIATFTFNRRGATQFRWWTPGTTTSTGLKVDPVYSSIFTLTVR